MDVVNATAPSTAVAGGARAIGPAIGGFVLAAGGAAACFFVNAASYAVVAAALSMMRAGHLVKKPAVDFIALLGVSLIGGPLMGWVAEALGPLTAFLLAAVPCAASARLAFYPTPLPAVRPVRVHT